MLKPCMLLYIGLMLAIWTPLWLSELTVRGCCVVFLSRYSQCRSPPKNINVASQFCWLSRIKMLNSPEVSEPSWRFTQWWNTSNWIKCHWGAPLKRWASLTRLRCAEEVWRRGAPALYLTARPAVHTNPSRKRRFLKTIFKPEECENPSILFVWTEIILKTEHFEND